MAHAISTGPSREQYWSITRPGFVFLQDYVRERFPDEKDVHYAMWTALCVNGISLDREYSIDPKLVIKMRDILLTCAKEIARGDAGIIEDYVDERGGWSPEVVAQVWEMQREIFNELVEILSRWRPEADCPQEA